MNSRPLLDYIAFPEDRAEAQAPAPADAAKAPNAAPFDTLEARLKDLAARLRSNMPAAPAPTQDLTLSAQVEAILKRRVSQATEPHLTRHSIEERQPAQQRPRVVIDPPPTVPAFVESATVDADFAKFSEAVYLIGQAARRFVDEPNVAAAPARPTAPTAPSTAEIDALSAILRETVSAFRSVADDIAVSAGEIRNATARDERTRHVSRTADRDRDGFPELQETVAAFRSVAQELAASAGEIRAAMRNDDRVSVPRRDRRDRYRDDEDEIHELRETVAGLQDRLDTLLSARRRTRY